MEREERFLSSHNQYMEAYRSGYNENDSKSFDRLETGPWVRIPPLPP